MEKRIITIILMMTVLLALPGFGTREAQATSKKTLKATVYDDVLKNGNYAYCLAAYNGLESRLYKVNLKTGKVTRLTGKMLNPKGMKYRKGYLYFASGSTDTDEGALYRIGVKSKKKKKLAQVSVMYSPYYVLGKNKIYYKHVKYDWDKDTFIRKYKQMNYDGSGKKYNKNITIKMSHKKSNATGYRLRYVEHKGETYYDEDWDEYVTEIYYKCYLIKPDGSKIYLCKAEDY